MTNKEKIQKALENWNDANCIIGYGLYVWNVKKRCYDTFTLDQSVLEIFIETLNLKGVKHGWGTGSTFYNQNYIQKKINGIENDINSLKRQIKELKKESEPYKNALEPC